MTAYVTGTSTRKVDDLVRALGCDSGVSKSTVSRICKGIDDEVAVFRTRPLGHVVMPYVYLDATYIKARNNHRIVDAPSWLRLRSPWTATVKCSALTSVTPKTKCSGRRSCARCATVASTVCAW